MSMIPYVIEQTSRGERSYDILKKGIMQIEACLRIKNKRGAEMWGKRYQK